MPEIPFEPISEPYPSDFESEEQGGAYAGPAKGSEESDLFAKDREDIKERMRKTEIRNALAVDAADLLSEIISHKEDQKFDAARQSDAELITELEAEIKELAELRRDIRSGKEQVIDSALEKLKMKEAFRKIFEKYWE